MLVEPDLIEKARAADPQAFNELVAAYRKRTMGTISRLIGRPEDVEDVALAIGAETASVMVTSRCFRAVALPAHGECGL